MLLKQYQETCKRSLLFCDWIQLQVYGIVNSVHFNSVHPKRHLVTNIRSNSGQLSGNYYKQTTKVQIFISIQKHGCFCIFNISKQHNCNDFHLQG